MMKAKIKQFKIELILINEKVLVTFSFFLPEVSLVRNQICIFSKNGCFKGEKKCDMIMVQKGGIRNEDISYKFVAVTEKLFY